MSETDLSKHPGEGSEASAGEAEKKGAAGPKGADRELRSLAREPADVIKQPESFIEKGTFKEGSPAYHQDRVFYRGVAFSLAAVAILAVVGFIVLSCFDKTIPEGLVALGSASIGALAAVFTGASRT